MSKQNHLKVELARKQRFINIFHNRVTAWVILTISLVLTATAYFISKSIVHQRRSEQFHFRADEIKNAIEDRMRIYEQVLWGGVGLFQSTNEPIVSHDVFARYIESLNIQKHWPGIQGIGFSIPLKRNELSVFEKKMRSSGFPKFKVKPVGEREEYSSIIYLEPFDWRNQRAHGYDMWSNDMRRNAMLRAREQGGAATSGMITLVQETSQDVQRGFLTYVPVYRTRGIPKTVEGRRKQFVGWVYAAFRAGDLMKGITGSEDKKIEFKIYDGREPNADSLLYSTQKSEESEQKYAFEKRSEITLQGQPWTILFNTPTDAFTDRVEFLPEFIAFFGVLVDLLLFYVIFSLHFINRRVEALAEEKTRELKDSNVSLERSIKERTKELENAKVSLEAQVQSRTKELEEKLKEVEIFNKVTMGREERVIELKKEVNEFAKKAGVAPPYELGV